jgi:hypothetical protein
MDLKELLGEELWKSVKEKLGDKKLIINDGSYLPKAKIDEKIDEIKLLKEKVDSLEKTSKETETLLKDNEELKKKYDVLQTESKTQLEAKDKQIANIVKKTALSKTLSEKGAKYPDLLMKEFDIDSLELDGESVKNFENLFTPLAEKYKDMFPEKKIEGKDPAKGKEAIDPAKGDFSWMDNIK